MCSVKGSVHSHPSSVSHGTVRGVQRGFGFPKYQFVTRLGPSGHFSRLLTPPLMGYRHPLTGLGWFGLLGLGVRFEEGSVPGFVGHCVHPLPPKGCGWGVDGRGWGLCSPLLFWSAAVPGGLWGHRRDWQHQELLSQRLCRSLRGAGKGWRWWLPCDSSAAIWGQTPGLMGPPPPLQTPSQPSRDLGDPTLSPPQTPTVTPCPHCHISSCIHHGIS